MPSFQFSDTEIESDGCGSRCKKIKNKPLMEKKRRARINRSLSQLKQILIQDEHKNSAQHSKWEKADILEMTVEYLQQLRSQNCISSPSTSSIPTPTSSSSTPSEEKTNIPITPIIPFMNPIMQQYVAFQQLAHITMYSQMINNSSGMSFPLGNIDCQPNIESADLKEKSKTGVQKGF